MDRTEDMLPSGHDDQAKLITVPPESAAHSPPRPSSQRKTFADLPVETLWNIFEIGHEGYYRNTYIVCLAITSWKLYKAFKKVYPGPIRSRQGDMFHDPITRRCWDWELEYHIGTFLGPEYRAQDSRFSWHRVYTKFLKRSIYGDMYGDKEKALNERWAEWNALANNPRSRCGSYPTPFGRGEEWYAKVFEIFDTFPTNKILDDGKHPLDSLHSGTRELEWACAAYRSTGSLDLSYVVETSIYKRWMKHLESNYA